MTDDLFRVGTIIGTHGLKGEIKVFPTTSDPDRFLDLKDVLLGDDEKAEELLPVVVERVRFFKNIVIVKLKGYDNINLVEHFKGSYLLVTRENAIPLYEGEYYVKDLIGLSVVSDEGVRLGILYDVMETGANDVYVIKKEGKKDLLLPAIKQCILSVDLASKKMTVHLIPGLLELNQ